MIIVVTGASGNVGRPLVNELIAAGADVRAVTRAAAQAALPAGVQLFEHLRSALPGASAAFLNSRAIGADLPVVADWARDAGVGKLVALSASNVDDDLNRQPSRFRGDRNREIEALVVASGVPWVSLRPAVFATNFAGMWAGQIRAGDVIAGPYALASSAPIVPDDIAAVAARALLTDDLDGSRIPLTGPQALTNVDLVAILAEVLGRNLTYREVPAEVVRARFTAIGFSPEFGDAYVAMLAATLESPALVTHDVEKILGRQAISFARWASENRNLVN